MPDFQAVSFAPQSTGNLVLSGYTGLYHMQLVRIHVDGSLDREFGTDGFVPGANGGPVHVLPDDSILLASGYNGTRRIDRFTEDGEPLTSFGRNGQVDLEELTDSGYENELVLYQTDVDAEGRTSSFPTRGSRIDGSRRSFSYCA